MGTTADQLAARHFAGNTPISLLELTGEGGNATCGQGATGCGFGSTTAFRTPFQPLPMEDNPRKIFYQLFGQGVLPGSARPSCRRPTACSMT